MRLPGEWIVLLAMPPFPLPSTVCAFTGLKIGNADPAVVEAIRNKFNAKTV